MNATRATGMQSGALPATQRQRPYTAEPVRGRHPYLFMKGNVHGQEQDPQEPEGSDLQIGPETHRRLSRRVDRLNRNPAVAVTQPWNWPTGVRSPRQPRQAPPRAFRRAVDSSYCLRERTGKTTVR